jgi:hypothetical protein
MYKNEKILAPLRPNVGLEYMFRRALTAAIARMHEDVKAQIAAAWEGHADRPGTALAAQDSGEQLLQALERARKRFRELGWDKRGPYALALDDQPSVGAFIMLVRRLISVWSARFNTMARELAVYFAQAVQTRSDATSFRNTLARSRACTKT